MALAVQHIQLEQVIGLHAGRCIGLHHHALESTCVREVVHIAGPQRRSKNAVDGVKAHAQGVGLVAVDVELKLWRIFKPVGTHGGQHFAFTGHAQQLIARRQQHLAAQAGAVLQSKAET